MAVTRSGQYTTVPPAQLPELRKRLRQQGLNKCFGCLRVTIPPQQGEPGYRAQPTQNIWQSVFNQNQVAHEGCVRAFTDSPPASPAPSDHENSPPGSPAPSENEDDLGGYDNGGFDIEDPQPAPQGLCSRAVNWCRNHKLLTGLAVAAVLGVGAAYLSADSVATVCFQTSETIKWCQKLPSSADITQAVFEQWDAIKDFAPSNNIATKPFHEVSSGLKSVQDTVTKLFVKNPFTAFFG